MFINDEGAAEPRTSGQQCRDARPVRPTIEEAGQRLVIFNCIKLALNSGVSKLIGNNRQQPAHNNRAVIPPTPISRRGDDACDDASYVSYDAFSVSCDDGRNRNNSRHRNRIRTHG